MTKEEIIQQIDLVQLEFEKQKQEIAELNGILRSKESRLKMLKGMLKKDENSSLNDIDFNKKFKAKKYIKSYSEVLQNVFVIENYQIGLYELNVVKRILKLNNDIQPLTEKENQLLALLAANMNQLLSRSYMLTAIWNDNSYFSGRSMDVYLCKLRVLLKDDDQINIVNYRGKGYKLLVM